MLANAINTHIIVGERADGVTVADVRDNADAANTLFEHRLKLPQGATDHDGDGETDDTQYRWLMWYAKGRLIKYRRLDH
jgi:hypothetical protein